MANARGFQWLWCKIYNITRQCSRQFGPFLQLVKIMSQNVVDLDLMVCLCTLPKLFQRLKCFMKSKPKIKIYKLHKNYMLFWVSVMRRFPVMDSIFGIALKTFSIMLRQPVAPSPFHEISQRLSAFLHRFQEKHLGCIFLSCFVVHKLQILR